MARVRLTADVDPNVRRRVRIAAIERDTSVSDWVEQAVIRELEREQSSAGDHDIVEVDAKGRRYIAPGISMPSPGTKPRGSNNPPRLRGEGGTVADAVIEDRR